MEFFPSSLLQGYTVEQKRHIFIKFVELFHDKSFPQELKAKALQYVIIPMFAASFDKGEGDSVSIRPILYDSSCLATHQKSAPEKSNTGAGLF